MMLSGCAGIPELAGGADKNDGTEDWGQLITVLKPIDNLPILVTYEGGIRYKVRASNMTGNMIKLIWDDSAYVSTGGQSIRIVHIPGNELPSNGFCQQSSSPIAPYSELRTSFSGDRWIELVKSGGMPMPKDNFRKGRIYLTFEIKGQRVNWQGEVTFVSNK